MVPSGKSALGLIKPVCPRFLIYHWHAFFVFLAPSENLQKMEITGRGQVDRIWKTVCLPCIKLMCCHFVLLGIGGEMGRERGEEKGWKTE